MTLGVATDATDKQFFRNSRANRVELRTLAKRDSWKKKSVIVNDNRFDVRQQKSNVVSFGVVSPQERAQRCNIMRAQRKAQPLITIIIIAVYAGCGQVA